MTATSIPHPGPTAQTLRAAFGQFATGVAVATARGRQGEWTAVTVNSFVSVSLDPPLVSFSLACRARCLASFADCDALAVSVLRHDDERIAANFARPSSCRWDGIDVRHTAGGCLTIAHALASFECERAMQIVAGDHVIFVLSVRSVEIGPAARPLVFFRSGYGSFTADQADQANRADRTEWAEWANQAERFGAEWRAPDGAACAMGWS